MSGAPVGGDLGDRAAVFGTERGRRPAAWRRAWSIGAGVVLVSGVTGFVIAGVAWRDHVSNGAKSSFSAEARAVASALGTSLQNDKNVVSFEAALVSSEPGLTNEQFESVFDSVDFALRYPGGLGFGYTARVPASELTAFSAFLDADPPGTPLPRPYVVRPAGNRPQYCLARFGIPSALQGYPITTDLCAPTLPGLGRSPAPAVLDKAATTGKPVAFALRSIVTLLEHRGGSDNPLVHFLDSPKLRDVFVLFAPVYQGGRVPSTPKARMQRLLGWASGTFSGAVALQAALGEREGLGALVALAGPGKRAVTVTTMGPLRGGSLFRVTEAVPPDPQWRVEVTRLDATSATAQGVAVAVMGSLLSLLVFWFLVHLARRHERALALVEERTEQLHHQSLHDALTGLPNRELLVDRAERMLQRARQGQRAVGALWVDLDNFKGINALGHEAGDSVLRAVGTRLKEALREGDSVGRIGGDEFMVLVESDSLDIGPELVADRVRSLLAEPFEVRTPDPVEVTLTASIGVAVGARETAAELFGDAEIAVHEAKSAGKNQAVVFCPEMQRVARDRLAIELELRSALDNGELFVVYQPTFQLEDLAVNGAEALLRWAHPTRGAVPPGLFIPVAEDNGMITAIGRFVLEQACRDAAEWHARGFPVGVSVNVSARQLATERFADDLERLLAEAAMDPSLLTLEITETMLMRDTELASEMLQDLKRLGVRIAIDDFGTGYSSLAYLRQFPVDALKIDKSFVARVPRSSGSRALLRTLIELGKALGIETVAEGIERVDQLKHLQRVGCDSGQGFLYARPIEREALLRFFVDHPVAQPPTSAHAAPRSTGRSPTRS